MTSQEIMYQLLARSRELCRKDGTQFAIFAVCDVEKKPLDETAWGSWQIVPADVPAFLRRLADAWEAQYNANALKIMRNS